MFRQKENIFNTIIFLAILSVSVSAGPIYPPQYNFKCSPTTRCRNFGSFRLSRRSTTVESDENMSAMLYVSRRQRVIPTEQDPDGSAHRDDESSTDLSYNDLGPIGKTVAGCTEIVVATVFDYCGGFAQGLLFGTLCGSPGFLFRPVTKGVRQPFMAEISGRFSRMNVRSLSWAKKFSSISAAFGGFGVAVKVIRNGEEDAWNSVFSSAAAGAFFARKDGPQAMLRGALLYGGLIYCTSGRKNVQLQEYAEKPAAEF